MKKYMFFGIICLSLLSNALLAGNTDENYNKLVTAIEESDSAAAKRFLGRMEKLTIKEKRDLLKLAQDTLDEKAKKISLSKSPQDSAKFAAGGLLSGLGTFLGCLALNPGTNARLAAGALGAIGLGAGIPLVVNGFNCATATSNFNNAEEIEKLIKEAPETQAEETLTT